MEILRRPWRRISLTAKMLTLTVASGLLITAVTDVKIDRIVERLFEVHLQGMLNLQAQEDRLRLDHFMKNFYQVVRLTAAQKSFDDHVRALTSPPGSGKGPLRHKRFPPWFLSPSALRSLAVPRVVMLLDSAGTMLEMYLSPGSSLPRELLAPDALLVEKSVGQTHIAILTDTPFLVSAERYDAGGRFVTLMIASPIDDHLLLDTQGDNPHRLVGLVSGDGRILVTSNDYEKLTPGTPIEALENEYVIAGREYHDYGGAEMIIRVSSFVSRAEITGMAKIFVEKERRERMLTAAYFILTFAGIMFWITWRVRKLTDAVSLFSVEALGGKAGDIPRGDRLNMLEESFQMLTTEVVDSHRKVKAEAEDKAFRQLELSRQERALTILRAAMDTVGVGVMVGTGKSFVSFNELMRQYEDAFSDLASFDLSAAAGELDLEDRTGSLRTFQVSRPALRVDEKVLLVREVTEQKESLFERERLERDLAQARKLESIGRLAGGVAHDFNNILSAIIGYAELILNGLQEDDPLRGRITVIYEAGLKAADLTSQLLAFSRKQAIAPVVTNLNTSIGNLAKMLARLIGADVALTFQKEAALWNIKMDSSQIDQVLLNLAVNARDAMPTGGELTIATKNVEACEGGVEGHRPVKPGEYVLLTVSDSGQGIGEEDLEQIFDPFFTTKEMGKGTGLGLATLYGIVKQNDGYVFVDSAIGAGAAFSLYLPRCREEVEVPADGEAALPSGNETILLVEDQEEVRTLAVTVLSELGYTVIEAAEGVEALETFSRFHGTIDLVFTDVIMPKMGGYELIGRILALDGKVKILSMTGYSESAKISEIAGRKIPSLQKPLTAARLARAVREALDS